MKLLIITQYFPPEVGAPQNRLYGLAVKLIEKGDTVTVLTAMPNYPDMKIHDPYKNKWFVRESVHGLDIFRSWIFVSRSSSVFRRLLNYFSFVFSSAIVGLVKVKKHDFIFCESPPLFLGISAYLLAFFKGGKLIFNVSDLWPESAEKLGLVTNRFFLGITVKLEEFIYKKAAIITCQTQGIVKNISSRFPDKKIYWLRNGVDTEFFSQQEPSSWRKENGFEQSDLLLLYAGIIGHAQGLEVILNAAKLLEGFGDIRFIIMGSGPEKDKLLSVKNKLNLNNVRFFDLQPKNKMPAVLSAIDASIIPLKNLDLFKGAIPSKIFENLAMKKPILLGVDGEAKDLFIEQGKCGLYFEPENHAQLAEQIKRLYYDRQLIKELGENSFRYVNANFNRDRIVSEFRELLCL